MKKDIARNLTEEEIQELKKTVFSRPAHTLCDADFYSVEMKSKGFNINKYSIEPQLIKWAKEGKLIRYERLFGTT